MSNGHNDSRVEEAPDCIIGSGPLGRQCDHPDRATAGVEHGVDLGGVRIAHLGRVVCSAPRLAQPRPLQVDARDGALPR